MTVCAPATYIMDCHDVEQSFVQILWLIDACKLNMSLELAPHGVADIANAP